MDINNTYFHLLSGENDWQPILQQASISDLWWDRERTSLGLLPKVLQFPQRPVETKLTALDRRGAAHDRYGNFYWIDANDERCIRILPSDSDDAGDYWNVSELLSACKTPQQHGDFQPAEHMEESVNPVLRGLAVTGHHYLVVGTLQPSGLLIFDLHAGGVPLWNKWPESVPFAPYDLAAAADGGLWILDRDLSSEQGQFWYLDKYFRVHAMNGTVHDLSSPIHGEFSPEQEQSQECLASYFPEATEIDTGSPVMLRNPVAIEGLPDGSVLLLGSGTDDSYSVIQRFYNGRETNSVELQGKLFHAMLEEPKLKGYDIAFITRTAKLPGMVEGELSLMLENGNQVFEFNLETDRTTFSLRIRPRYVPVRQFSGKALIATEQRVYYDINERWYPLTAQPRKRYISYAELGGLHFDGKKPGCVWHRIVVDGCIPEGAKIEFDSRSADDKGQLAYCDWRPEPAPYKREDGSEIHLHHPFTKQEASMQGTGTWEWLLQNARGRYLELRMRFKSNGKQTPRIRAMRVYYPRFSYLTRFLPAIYTEQDMEMHFLERYLANTEGFFTTLEDRIARMQSMLDTRTAPEEFLEWLAAWLGCEFNTEWEDQRRRLFLDHAELLYRWRGTQIGMRAAIRLAIDACPDARIFQELKDQRSYSLTGAAGGRVVRIVERFLYRDLPGVFIGDPTEQKGLGVVSVKDSFEALGKKEDISAQYRNFLYRRYNTIAPEPNTPLDALNSAWEKDFDSFDDIHFNQTRPKHAVELVDWFQFIQRELALTQAWQPAHGIYALHVRYQESLRKRYALNFGESEALSALNERWNKTYRTFEEISFPPIEPKISSIAEDWNVFIHSEIGFTYSRVTVKDTEMYREFLARRYRRIDRLNQVYGLVGDDMWPSFAHISLPSESDMPSSERRLHDWIQFVSLMLPIRRNAHRFTVLVPTEPGELPQSRARRMAQVESVVAREKPAHTDFDVKLYWALFQVGSARLGQDTVLGEGARYVAIALGSTYIGQGVVGSSHPWNIQDRTLIDRDPLSRSTKES